MENVIQIVIHFARNLLEIYWHYYQRFAASFLEVFAKKFLSKIISFRSKKKLKKFLFFVFLGKGSDPTYGFSRRTPVRQTHVRLWITCEKPRIVNDCKGFGVFSCNLSYDDRDNYRDRR
jgi:hypothetical protein